MTLQNSKYETFKEVINNRSHWKWFDSNKRIPDDLLKDIMETAQRAPSSFNTQPHKVVIVRDNEYKLALAEGMLGDSNKNVVLTADTNAVFLADLEITNDLTKIQDLWRSTSAPKEYVEHFIPMGIRVCSVGFSGLMNYIMRPLLWSILTVVGLFSKKFPNYNPVPSWAFRQAGFFADHFVLTANAAGLKTAVMEGFNGNEVMRQLNIPSRYKVFCVVSLGYPKENAPGRDQMSKRFDMNDVYFHNKFGSSF